MFRSLHGSSNNNRFHVSIEADPPTGSYRLVFYEVNPHTGDISYSTGDLFNGAFVMATRQAGEATPPNVGFTIPWQYTEAFVDAFGGQGGEEKGRLSAVEKHLEDMREVAKYLMRAGNR